MAARFQVDVKSGSFGFRARALESNDLGVVCAGDSMKSCGDDFPASHQYCADHWIRTRPTRSFAGKTTSHA
jgi:hypothetical protein